MTVPTVNTATPQVAGALRQAAARTGTSFDYLLTTARLESGLNPNAQAPTSSAGGLFQFIDQTWLGMVKAVGPAVGFGDYAQAIVKGPDGRYEVPDPAARKAILGMRNDPAASATMAGVFAHSNAAQLAGAIGRSPSESELYMAHFLGAEGAGRLINAAAAAPGGNAAEMFPSAAAANRAIFYDSAGHPRTTGQVYAQLSARFETARAATGAPDLRGEIAPAVASAAPAVSDTAGVTQALAAAHDPQSIVPDTRPLFQAMFTDRGASAVAPAVTSLWAPSAASAAGRPALDLFTDGKPNLRGMFGAS